MTMRHIISILLLICCVILPVDAKVKVVDSSSKRAPEWNNGTSEESIIASTVSEISLDDAKRRAVEQIKIKVIESIAQNINHSSLSKIEQKSGDEDSFTDEFKSALLLNSAKLPFISGISESKIEAFYWAVHEDSKSKSRSYIYSIKYPLKHAEVEEFIRKFELLDNEKAQELEMLEEGYANLSSIDNISEAISKCEELDAYFFDSARRAKVKSVKEKYTSLYSRISVVTRSEELGRATVALQIGDRVISATSSPTARYDREAIHNLKITPMAGSFEISYDPTFCEERLPYVISLSVPVGVRRVNHEITFTKSEKSDLKIQPEGVVTLTAQQIAERSLTNIQINLDLLVEGLPANTPITVNKITLRVPNLKDEIYCDKVMTSYVEQNRVDVTLVATTTIATTGEKSGSTIKLLSGEISGYYGSEKRAFNSKFSRSYRCNW